MMPGKNNIPDVMAFMATAADSPAASEMLSMAGHELRAPLGVIKGFTSSLRRYGDQMSDAERDEALQEIDEAADRMSELIDAMLTARPLEHEQPRLRLRLVDMAALARAVIAEVGAVAPGHVMIVDAADPPPLVLGDEGRLRQVLLNLADNAVKYSPRGETIHLGIMPRDGMVEVSVTDQGIGIAAAQRQRIFEWFYRGDNGGIGGTGQGLAIVKSLVEAHGGSVWAESAGPGRGSTFVVTLPQVPGCDQATTPALLRGGEEVLACTSAYGHADDGQAALHPEFVDRHTC